MKNKQFPLKQLLVIGVVILLALGGLALLWTIPEDGEEGTKKDVIATGDEPLQEETRQRWMEYLSANGNDVTKAPEIGCELVREEELTFRDDLPDIDEEGAKSSWDGADQTYDDTNAGTGGADRDGEEEAAPAEDSNEEREVEESDIVKVSGDEMYILNPYTGLIIVDISDKDSPEVVSRLSIMGNPVSMYIVDFLGFIIVTGEPDGSGQYDNWQRGSLFVINLLDISNPGVVKKVPINGYPTDSRRVGEVIYVVSSMYDHIDEPVYVEGEETVVYDEEYTEERSKKADPDMENASDTDAVERDPDEEGPIGSDDEAPSEGGGDGSENPDDGYLTEVVSIGFHDPDEIGEVDRETFSSSAQNIHVSSKALFVSSTIYNWGATRSEDLFRTKITYVDISDPRGDIRVEDSITLKGELQDRYQMDQYGELLRVVTQVPDRELPISMLYVVDLSDPSDLSVVGDLEIDDAGSLMATRFAGERGYTIHLPYSVDPLDVLDLSDPEDPKLCDVLEIPGWVEHMEVRGHQIIAIGVDDQNGTRVSVSLFNVSDPYNAVLSDRITVGDGPTYSEANWDPKALTVVDEEGLVLIPYTSYSMERWWGQGTYGLKIVSFDLQKEDLRSEGSISGAHPVRRTRYHEERILATSEMSLQVVDATDLLEPVVTAELALAGNIPDVILSGDLVIGCRLPSWGGSGARIVVSDRDDPYREIGDAGPTGLEFESVKKKGDRFYVKGIRQGDKTPPRVEVHVYDVSSPPGIVELEVLSLEVNITDAAYRPYYYDLPMEKDGGAGALWYDPYGWEVLDDYAVVLYMSHSYYYYDQYSSTIDNKVHVASWDSSGGLEMVSFTTNSTLGYSMIRGTSREFLMVGSSWYGGYSTSVLHRSRLSGGVYALEGPHILRGRPLDVNADLSIVYTALDWWDDENYVNTLNGFDISGGEPYLLFSLEMESDFWGGSLMGDRLVITYSGYGYYYPVYGGGIGSGMAIEEDGRYEEGYEEYRPETLITVLDLEDGVPTGRSHLRIDGYYYSTTVADGYLLMQGGFSLVTVDPAGENGPEVAGSHLVPGHVQGADADDDGIMVAMGYSGLLELEL